MRQAGAVCRPLPYATDKSLVPQLTKLSEEAIRRRSYHWQEQSNDGVEFESREAKKSLAE